jgi:dUTPase
VTVLAGVIDPDHQGQIEVLLHNDNYQEYAQNAGDL